MRVYPSMGTASVVIGNNTAFNVKGFLNSADREFFSVEASRNGASVARRFEPSCARFGSLEIHDAREGRALCLRPFSELRRTR